MQGTLQLRVAGDAPTGARSLKLRATYGDRTAERDLTLTVSPPPDFTLSLSPTSLSVQQGSSAQTTLTLTPQNGFTGTVGLSLVDGNGNPVPGITLSPQSVTVSGSGPVTQALTVSVAPGVSPGTYNLQVRGTSGSLTRGAGLSLTVSAPSGGGGGGGGGSGTGSVNTPGGQVQLVLQGGTFTQGPTSQNISPPQGFQAPYGAIAFTAQVPQGGTLTVTLTFPNPIPQGAVLKKYLNNAWQDVPGAQLSGSTATYQVQDGGPLDADGQANGQVVDPVALLAPAPGFTLSLSPNALTVQQGGQGQVTVSLTRQNFTGQVTLSLEGNAPLATSPAPDKIAWSFNPNPTTGNQTTLALQVGAQVPAGNYTLTVRGQAQGLEDQTATLTLQVQPQPSFDFTIDGSSVTTKRDPNFQGNLIRLIFTTQNGFQGQVNLSLVDEQGNPVQGLSLSPTSVNLAVSWQDFYVWVLADNSIPLTGAGKGYPVRVRASSGNIVREQPLIVDVWTPVGSANLNFQRVAYGNGIFVVAGGNGYDFHNRIYVYNPQNGNFTMVYDVYGPDNVCGSIDDVAYDPVHQTWVTVGGIYGLIMVSTDNAQTWQIVYGAKDPNRSCFEQYGDGRPLKRVRYVNDRLWAWSEAWNSKGFYFSQDGGYTWNFVPLPVPQGYVNLQVKGLTFGQGKYVAVGVLFDSGSGAYPMLATSTNGVNWNVIPVDTPDTPWDSNPGLNDVIYVPEWGKFIVVGNLGLLGTSADGMNWNFQYFYDAGHLESVVYGNGTVVAGSWSFNKVLVSTDGQNWRIVHTQCESSAMSVAFGGGIFAHTAAGPLCTSP